MKIVSLQVQADGLLVTDVPTVFIFVITFVLTFLGVLGHDIINSISLFSLIFKDLSLCF